jgi:hypothetical protein
VISVVGVLVFAGLTAWDTHRLKTEYLHGEMDGETTERSAILGALALPEFHQHVYAATPAIRPEERVMISHTQCATEKREDLAAAE